MKVQNTLVRSVNIYLQMNKTEIWKWRMKIFSHVNVNFNTGPFTNSCTFQMLSDFNTGYNTSQTFWITKAKTTNHLTNREAADNDFTPEDQLLYCKTHNE